jgi:hypothetical protein
MGKVDAIVVTPVHVYESIYNNLKKMEIKIPIVSLEDIITSI